MASELSAPNTPGSTLPPDEELMNFQDNGLHLELAPFGLEKIYDYETDGHHPVHLGDTYGINNQYRVIHKLGHGGFATVWLCRDTKASGGTKYVALKILMAEASSDDCPELRVNQLKDSCTQNANEGNGAEFICLPLDHFKIKGPNGDHICFVYPVLGPNVSCGLFHTSADPDNDLRNIALKVAKGVKFLHSQGICHGDLTPNNILHRIIGLDELDEDEVLKILGNPVVNPVLNKSQEPHHEPTAPEYLVYPIKWYDLDTQFISKEPCIIDFGESFEVSQPPEELGIPGPYRSPELIIDKKASLGSDIWALGCSLFEIRTGRKLFDAFDDDDNEYLVKFVKVLGKLPEPWWSSTWKDRKRLFKDEDFDERGRLVAALEPEREPEVGVTVITNPWVADDARSLKDKIAPGVWYINGPPCADGDRHREILETEQEIFADLLRGLLEYKPEERLSAGDAMKHEWFRL